MHDQPSIWPRRPRDWPRPARTSGFVFDLLTATSLAELDLVIDRAVKDGAYFGKTTAACIVEEQRS